MRLQLRPLEKLLLTDGVILYTLLFRFTSGTCSLQKINKPKKKNLCCNLFTKWPTVTLDSSSAHTHVPHRGGCSLVSETGRPLAAGTGVHLSELPAVTPGFPQTPPSHKTLRALQGPCPSSSLANNLCVPEELSTGWVPVWWCLVEPGGPVR